MKTNTAKQVKELTTPFLPHFLAPNTKADLEFLTSADMVAARQNYGQIFTPELPDPSQCKVDTNAAVVGEKCIALLHLLNWVLFRCFIGMQVRYLAPE
jgi:hypothetical protein